jgi:hypothetical protein
MTLTPEGKWIRCDAPDCTAVAPAPVALRPALQEPQEPAETLNGWLFVHRGERRLHFCPRCLPQYLNTLPSDA